jgi:hypothetical protein
MSEIGPKSRPPLATELYAAGRLIGNKCFDENFEVCRAEAAEIAPEDALRTPRCAAAEIAPADALRTPRCAAHATMPTHKPRSAYSCASCA